ncbi:MAG: hypothetical protein M0R39_08185 [Prolixibacteraceae bacterium]|nr:hypothetical protein [Prolixibacteraceae bacterium]
MNKWSSNLVTEVEKLLALGRELIKYGKSNFGEMEPEKVQEFTFWTVRTGELFSKLYPKDNQYHKTFNIFRETLKMQWLHSNSYQLLYEILGILEAVKYDLENGLLDDIQKLLRADIFSDFLEMGEHLLKEGYKDPAAVIIGSVLEDTLRKLAIANDISTTNEKGKLLTIEPLNVELAKKEVYNQLMRKQITSWADIRNSAAHGHYDQYDAKQVDQMQQFVQAFAADYIR